MQVTLDIDVELLDRLVAEGRFGSRDELVNELLDDMALAETVRERQAEKPQAVEVSLDEL